MSASNTSVHDVLYQDLAGKNALVTGASRGIGRAIAFELALRGASVLGTCSAPTSLHHLDELARSVQSVYESSPYTAPKIIGLPADILLADTPTRLVDAVESEFGGKLHIMVNNAAYDEIRPVGQLDADYVGKILTGNIQTLVLSVELLFQRGFFQPNSRIVNVSSEMTRGFLPNSFCLRSGFVVFAATKSAIESLTRSWADVFGKHPSMPGTTVNALVVGPTDTDALRGEIGSNNEVIDHMISRTPIGPRLGTPEDIANITGLLVSEKAGWITGSAVAANGGSAKIL
ncbi:Short chain dehydrogenase asqE [Lasiodiplodia hormozganensis]|uniref:Short chain dehydrogenase asqE n=1 Tax=Lasiodiplodia hormozganensis TaxID=869390 RepID=A0AA39Y9M7_9PEZI|nr:Short chain dehydrogenase asqE [Lasiodiplodia hormozganensis]